MKKIKRTNLLALGVIIYLVFQLMVFLIGKNVNILVLKSEYYCAKIRAKGVVSKDVNSQDVYFLSYIGLMDSKNLQLDKDVEIIYKNQKLNGQVSKIYLENEKKMIKIKINEVNPPKYDTIPREFDIIYKRIECLKIPKESIKMIDNKQGVYVIDEESKKAKFVKLEGVAFEEYDFVFVDYYKNDLNKVKTVDLYDRIILKPNKINTNIRIE